MEGCQAYLARCEDRTYGFIQLTKEDCMNHVEKRRGKNLQSAIIKSDTERPLCGRGGLIKRLTSYYGQAPRGSDHAQDRQRAVMAACHHVTSTDKQPHPALCRGGQQVGAGTEQQKQDEPLPTHMYKYELKPHMASDMLSVFQQLSEPQLLGRCKGKKTQNAANSLHFTIWYIMPKDKHAAVETAVNAAVCRSNSGTLRA